MFAFKLYDFPLELLDIILHRSFLHWILSSPAKQRDEEVTRSLMSVDVCFHRRISSQRFKKAFFRYLKSEMTSELSVKFVYLTHKLRIVAIATCICSKFLDSQKKEMWPCIEKPYQSRKFWKLSLIFALNTRHYCSIWWKQHIYIFRSEKGVMFLRNLNLSVVRTHNYEKSRVKNSLHCLRYTKVVYRIFKLKYFYYLCYL